MICSGLPPHRGFHTAAGVNGDNLVVQRRGEDRVQDRRLAVLDGPGADVTAFHPGDPLPDVLGHDVAHLHRPKVLEQVPADLPFVVGPHSGFQLVVGEPFPQHVRLEGLPAPARVALLAGPDVGLGLLPRLGGLLLGGEGARRPLPSPDVEIASRVARFAIPP